MKSGKLNISRYVPQTQPTQMLPHLSRTPPHHRPLCRRLCIPPLHAGAAASPSELRPSPHNKKDPGPTSPDPPIVSKSYTFLLDKMAV